MKRFNYLVQPNRRYPTRIDLTCKAHVYESTYLGSCSINIRLIGKAKKSIYSKKLRRMVIVLGGIS